MKRLKGLLLTSIFMLATVSVSNATTKRGTSWNTDALVLVNSNSDFYLDYQHYIQPYLVNFGMPYRVLDISNTNIEPNISEYAVIIIGHKQLDQNKTYISKEEENSIIYAVSQGTGLVNFDNDLSINGTDRYQFIQDIFGFNYTEPTTVDDIISGLRNILQFIQDIFGFDYTGANDIVFGHGYLVPIETSVLNSHYITDNHEDGSVISTKEMTLTNLSLPLPDDVSALAMIGNQPFITVTTKNNGKAVQFGSYDWMSSSIKGPVFGLDDLVWKSIVWAARKPFIMQGLPPFVTMRIDDSSGDLLNVHVANEFGIKPWLGLFLDDIDDNEANELSILANAGEITASIHAFSYDDSFYYYHDNRRNYSDKRIQLQFATATRWHANHNIPISNFVLGHYYELGDNVFQGLKDWGVEFIGTMMDPGNRYYGVKGVYNGPYRKYETQNSDTEGVPIYYADFVNIPNHPELDGQFFNCITEIRDMNNYEWYPSNDIVDTANQGIGQLKRAFDSMVLATLFTHAYYLVKIHPINFRQILEKITSNISSYKPIYVTINYACQYIRAIHMSEISSAVYNPGIGDLRVVLNGKTDMNTMFYLFNEKDGQIKHTLIDVPMFNNSTEIKYLVKPEKHNHR